VDRDSIGDKVNASLHEWSREYDKAVLSQNAIRVLLKIGESLDAGVAARHGILLDQWRILQLAGTSTDEVAIRTFIERNYNDLRRMVRAHNRQLEIPGYDPEDALQEAIIHILQKGVKVWEETDLRLYLWKTVKNIVLDRYRLYRRAEALPLEEMTLSGIQILDETAADPSRVLEERQLLAAVEKAIESAGLSDKVRAAFKDAYLRNTPIAEIAARLNERPVTVSVMLRNARRKVREQLSAKGLMPVKPLRRRKNPHGVGHTG
jgi:RNA polymerase sigma factor (sigma-70 family)